MLGLLGQPRAAVDAGHVVPELIAFFGHQYEGGVGETAPLFGVLTFHDLQNAAAVIGKQAVQDLPDRVPGLRILGIGQTDLGGAARPLAVGLPGGDIARLVNQYALKMLGGPIGGYITDKVLHSATKYLSICFVIVAAALGVFACPTRA